MTPMDDYQILELTGLLHGFHITTSRNQHSSFVPGSGSWKISQYPQETLPRHPLRVPPFDLEHSPRVSLASNSRNKEPTTLSKRQNTRTDSPFASALMTVTLPLRPHNTSCRSRPDARPQLNGYGAGRVSKCRKTGNQKFSNCGYGQASRISRLQQDPNGRGQKRGGRSHGQITI